VSTDWFGTPMTPLAGGYSGETFLVGEGDDAVVLRIYRRDPDRAAVDASLLRLVRGIVAVPAVVDVRLPTRGQPGLLVTERVPGVPLDRLLREDSPDLDYDRLATSLADVLVRLSGVPFLSAGAFQDGSLAVSAIQLSSDLAEWARTHRDTTRLASWSESDWGALTRLVDQAEDLLDDGAGDNPARTVLVHSDLNPKNLLVDPMTAEVTALLDWEFAHAGSPFTDIGNLTRFERDERLLVPLLERFTERAPGGIQDAFRQGRAADLWALIELAGRPAGHPVGDLASVLLLAQARTGDLTAWPWTGRRVDPIAAHAVS
jgi:aminoglycoside phosphotransferase (APT) family kinase protein